MRSRDAAINFRADRSVPKWRLPHSPKFGFLRRRSWLEWALVWTLILYVFVCVCVYFVYVQPWINGDIETRIGADSDRYWDAVKVYQQGGKSSLISLTGNLIGPILEALVFQNGFFVMCCNVLLFASAMKIAGSIAHVNKAKFGFLVLMCPELLPTLATLNKEIFALLAGVATAKYLYSEKRSKRLLIFAMIVSIFARWEQVAILLLALLLSSGIFRSRPKVAITTLVLIITVAYPLTFTILGIDMSMFDWILDGANTIVKLDTIQLQYGFPIVVIPKIIMMMGGRLIQPAFLFSDELVHDIYQDPQQSVFQPLGCLTYFIVLIALILTKRASLYRPVPFFSAVTLVTCAASPFVQPRYLYGIYIMICIDLARPRELGYNRPQSHRVYQVKSQHPSPSILT